MAPKKKKILLVHTTKDKSKWYVYSVHGVRFVSWLAESNKCFAEQFIISDDDNNDYGWPKKVSEMTGLKIDIEEI